MICQWFLVKRNLKEKLVSLEIIRYLPEFYNPERLLTAHKDDGLLQVNTLGLAGLAGVSKPSEASKAAVWGASASQALNQLPPSKTRSFLSVFPHKLTFSYIMSM